MKCIVINGRRIIILLASVVLVLIIILAGIKVINERRECEVFLNEDLGMQIVSEMYPEKTKEPVDRNVKIIEQNPMFSAEVPLETEKPQETQTPEPSAEAEPTVTAEPEKIIEKSIPGKMDVHDESGYNVNLNEFAEKKLPISINDNGAQILVMHTHTTECYSSSEKTKYSSSEKGRTTNDTKNMVAIGNVITDILNNNGIKTIHDTTVHDYPTYNNAYTRAAATINKNLKENPGIKAVLDIHRDAVSSKNGSLKLTADIGNEKAAQIMIVAGTDKNGLKHENWRDNLTFAAHIQKNANEMYPGLMRNLNLRAERFNQHLTKGSLIIEVGSNTNTLEEALKAAEAFSNVLVAVIK